MKPKQKGFTSVGVLVAFLFAMPFASSIWLKAATAKQIYGEAQAAPSVEIAVVLGAAAYNADFPSPILQDRLDVGIELYRNGKAGKILLTGAPNEVEAMKNYVEEQQVPTDSILEDPKGVNTFASIQNIPKIYRNIILVTQKYHLPRAIFYAEHLGFQATGLAADRREYARMFDFKKRELLATSKAVMDAFSGILPRR